MTRHAPIRRAMVLSLPVFVLAALWLAPPALARLAANTINTTATVSKDGRHILLTGPIKCDRVQWVDLRVTVTQRDTGALAQGHVKFLGSPNEKTWKVLADAKGKNDFAPGGARAVALALSTANGARDDAHQWLVDVTLEEKK